MFNKKTKLKLTDFECNLLINGMNEFRNMLLAEALPTEGVTEQLKEENQLEWVQRMNNIQQYANEIVCKELIFTWSGMYLQLKNFRFL